MIKNLIPGLPEIGKVKIGFKGKEITSKQGKQFQPPNKLDHFIITGLERGPDGNFIKNAEIHKEIGDKPKELDVRLLYDDPDLNFLTRYACYSGTKLWCTGDGETAARLTGENGQRATVKCPCEHLESGYKGGPKCKPSGVLSVMLDNSPIVGGVHKLRTTSFNSVTNILSSMAMISRITGGVLAGIPLKLTFGKKTTTVPGTEQQTTIPIIGLVYKGSVRELAESGQKTALEFAGYRKRIEYIEDIARKQLDKEMGLGIYTEAETDEDIVAEFYPEQVGAGGPVATEKAEPLDTSRFVDLINKNCTDKELPFVDKYVKLSAKATGKTEDEIRIMFADDFEDSLKNFREWVSKQEGAAPEKSAVLPSEAAETSKAATSRQGPQPPKSTGEWDPTTNDLQQRYPGDKARILIESCKTHGIEYAGKSAKEMHQALLNSKGKILTDRENEQRADQEDGKKFNLIGPLFPKDMEPEKILAACEQIRARIKTIDENIFDQVAIEAAVTWDDVKNDHEMAHEFILYCFACYRDKGNVETLIPNGLKKIVNI